MSTNSGDLDGLAEVLGAEPPAGLAVLDQTAIDDLAGLIGHARQEQEAALLKAVDDALRIVPRPLRGIVKKVILP